MHSDTCLCVACIAQHDENATNTRETAFAAIARTMPFPNTYMSVLRSAVEVDNAFNEYHSIREAYGRDAQETKQAFSRLESATRQAQRIHETWNTALISNLYESHVD